MSRSIRRSGRHCHTRRGFTLLEVMVATAVTLLMMIALAQIFKSIGNGMKQGRAALELNNRLRDVVYRIRLDLDNMTAIPDPPADATTGAGYLKYYDGTLTDYSAALYTNDPSTFPSTDYSKYGDVDDIFMFTARAGDIWFTGKVPLFVLQGVAPTATNTGLVTIAAQHAEVILFVEPVVTNIGNPDRNPAFLNFDPAENYEKARTDDLPSGFTDLPERYRLYYRTLLIRPDLNIPATGILPNGSVTVAGVTTNYLQARPTTPLPTPTCDMIAAHQQCDLSIRRVNPFAATSTVAANSLEDLVDPANRFAHVQIPLATSVTAPASAYSMPILALSPKLSLPFMATDAGATTSATSPLAYQSGFLHPAFSLSGTRTGEDILASDILAFDIKGYDPGAPLLGVVGADGVFGTNDPQPPPLPRGDDDGNGIANDVSELGWAGSDDLVLSPNDPGYGSVLTTGTVVGTGEYVDLCWGRKLVAHGATISAATNVWSQLSGLSQDNFIATGNNFPFTDALYRSGLVVQTGALSAATPPAIFQPAYDTWTTRYESDGILQTERSVNRGVTRIADLTTSGPALSPQESWRRNAAGVYIVDAGTDGIDNNGGGVDDITEQETSPPFPTKLRGIKISIRMEDPSTRQIKQMSVAKEFVTQ